MTLIAHGIDIVECERVTALAAKHPERFFERLFTPDEQAYIRQYKNPAERIAGRFAAKEAILKMLGTGWRGDIAWTDMEVLNNPAGAPVVTLTGECARVAEQLGIKRVVLSISHTQEYAVGSAIGVSE